MHRRSDRLRLTAIACAVAAFVIFTAVAPFFMSDGTNMTDLSASFRSPGEDGFPLGSDALGRDVLARTVAGGRQSVLSALGVLAVIAFFGGGIGLFAGYKGGTADYLIDKVITAFQAFPGFVLAVAIAGILGPGLINMLIALAAVYWTSFARLSRSVAKTFKHSDCLKAARMCGANDASILTKYLFPQVRGPLAVLSALSVSDIVLTMAGLSFIGLGMKRPTDEWGAMMAEAQPSFQYAVWCMLVPMAALFVTVVLFNLLADALRDALDPHSRALSRACRKRPRKDTPMNDRNHLKRKVSGAVSLSLTALLCVTLLGGCSDMSSDASQTVDSPDAPQKTLHAGSTTYFYAESMDPASDWDSWYLSYYGIVETLFKVDEDLTPVPLLARSMENVDDHTWKITLRDDVVFSNGEPMDAAAVKAAWERTYEENPRARETLDCTSLEADGSTLTLTTASVITSMENVLCDPLLCVYYVGEDIDYADFTPATGPYMKKDFIAEDHIVMVPNPYYWNGTPKLSEVTLTCFSDDNTITMAMQSGELDAVAMPSASTLTSLERSGDWKLIQRTSSRADFIRMNMTHPLIENDAVRTAIAYCIDRDGYADIICRGSAAPSWGVYSPTLPFGGTEGLDVMVTSCDLDAAAAVLNDAGIVDGDGDGIRELDGTPVRINLYTCTNYERFVMLADDLQSKLMSIGIELDIVPTDYFLEDAETFAQDDPDMTLDSYAMAPTGNQAYFANIAFATDASNNFGKYSNAEADVLIERLNATYDENERDALARDIAQTVLDDLPYVFFSNARSSVICAEQVSGLDASPSEYYFITVETDVA